MWAVCLNETWRVWGVKFNVTVSRLQAHTFIHSAAHCNDIPFPHYLPNTHFKKLQPPCFFQRKERHKSAVSNKYKKLSLPVCSISMASKANNNSTNCDQAILLVSPTTSISFVPNKETDRPSLKPVSLQKAHWRQDYLFYRNCICSKPTLGSYHILKCKCSFREENSQFTFQNSQCKWRNDTNSKISSFP